MAARRRQGPSELLARQQQSAKRVALLRDQAASRRAQLSGAVNLDTSPLPSSSQEIDQEIALATLAAGGVGMAIPGLRSGAVANVGRQAAQSALGEEDIDWGRLGLNTAAGLAGGVVGGIGGGFAGLLGGPYAPITAPLGAFTGSNALGGTAYRMMDNWQEGHPLLEDESAENTSIDLALGALIPPALRGLWKGAKGTAALGGIAKHKLLGSSAKSIIAAARRGKDGAQPAFVQALDDTLDGSVENNLDNVFNLEMIDQAPPERPFIPGYKGEDIDTSSATRFATDISDIPIDGEGNFTLFNDLVENLPNVDKTDISAIPIGGKGNFSLFEGVPNIPDAPSLVNSVDELPTNLTDEIIELTDEIPNPLMDIINRNVTGAVSRESNRALHRRIVDLSPSLTHTAKSVFVNRIVKQFDELKKLSAKLGANPGTRREANLLKIQNALSDIGVRAERAGYAKDVAEELTQAQVMASELGNLDFTNQDLVAAYQKKGNALKSTIVRNQKIRLAQANEYPFPGNPRPKGGIGQRLFDIRNHFTRAQELFRSPYRQALAARTPESRGIPRAARLASKLRAGMSMIPGMKFANPVRNEITGDLGAAIGNQSQVSIELLALLKQSIANIKGSFSPEIIEMFESGKIHAFDLIDDDPDVLINALKAKGIDPTPELMSELSRLSDEYSRFAEQLFQVSSQSGVKQSLDASHIAKGLVEEGDIQRIGKDMYGPLQRQQNYMRRYRTFSQTDKHIIAQIAEKENISLEDAARRFSNMGDEHLAVQPRQRSNAAVDKELFEGDIFKIFNRQADDDVMRIANALTWGGDLALNESGVLIPRGISNAIQYLTETGQDGLANSLREISANVYKKSSSPKNALLKFISTMTSSVMLTNSFITSAAEVSKQFTFSGGAGVVLRAYKLTAPGGAYAHLNLSAANNASHPLADTLESSLHLLDPLLKRMPKFVQRGAAKIEPFRLQQNTEASLRQGGSIGAVAMVDEVAEALHSALANNEPVSGALKKQAQEMLGSSLSPDEAAAAVASWWNPELGRVADDAMIHGRKTLTHRWYYTNAAMELPPIMSTDVGKVATMYKPFMLKAWHHVKDDVFQPIVEGMALYTQMGDSSLLKLGLGRLGRIANYGLPISAAATMAKSAMRGRIPTAYSFFNQALGSTMGAGGEGASFLINVFSGDESGASQSGSIPAVSAAWQTLGAPFTGLAQGKVGPALKASVNVLAALDPRLKTIFQFPVGVVEESEKR